MAQSSRPCDGCGRDVPRKSKTAPIPRYCGDRCKPRCTVERCGQPRRKREWCASHYAQWQRTGEDPKPFGYKWADATLCKVCGNPPGYGYREFCGGTCAALWRAYGGKVPMHRDCVGCGKRISLARKGKGGQRIHSVIKFCRRCKQDYDKYKMTAAQLAARDGTDCGICGEPVDMTLRRSDPGGVMCASVDHIIPRSRGGTHEPENLQLAHLYCNQVKSDRVGDEAA